MKRLRVGITGASGMLGGALIFALERQFQVFAASRTRGYDSGGATWDCFDLTATGMAAAWIAGRNLDVVIHAAAMVDVDACEAQPGLAERLHVTATKELVKGSAQVGAWFIYISTDSVFDGIAPGSYTESDPANPINCYARTKLGGECAARDCPQWTVLRTNIFGWRRYARPSLAEWLLRKMIEGDTVSGFADVWFTPVNVAHFAELVANVIHEGVTGLFHAGGSDSLTKYAFALALASAFDLPERRIVPARIADSGLGAARAMNTSLCSDRLAGRLNTRLATVADGLDLLERQYSNGWRTAVTGRQSPGGYRYWGSVA